METYPSVDEFLAECQRFHENLDTSAPAFPVSRWLSQSGYQLPGISFILLTWNRFWTGRHRTNNQGERLGTQIERALERSSNEREHLRDRTLLDIDLSDPVMRDYIEGGFRAFREEFSISITGASKGLATLNPDLWVMWDSKVRKCYHEVGNDQPHSNHGASDHVQCYISYLQQCQNMASELVEAAGGEAKLLDRHYGQLPDASIAVYELLDLEPTIPKLLDEYNMETITGV